MGCIPPQRNFAHFNRVSSDIKIVETSKLISIDDNTLLVVDVQGFEMEVLTGIDYNKPPKYIIIESEKSSNLKLKKLHKDHEDLLHHFSRGHRRRPRCPC